MFVSKELFNIQQEGFSPQRNPFGAKLNEFHLGAYVKKNFRCQNEYDKTIEYVFFGVITNTIELSNMYSSPSYK